MNKTTEAEITCYRVNDGCEGPMLFDDLEGAIEYLKGCLDGINYDFPIEITKVKMTQKEFNKLPEA